SEEDARHLHRTRVTLQQDRTRSINRLKGLMASPGLAFTIDKEFLRRLKTARLWAATAIPPGLKARLERVWAQREFVNEPYAAMDAERPALVPTSTTTLGRYIAALPTRQGIGPTGTWT